MLDYIHSLLGIPYRWWNPEVSCCDVVGPFWASEGGEVPIEQIRLGHLNCAGLLNVLCRKLQIEIPGAKERHWFAGGTGLWWDFFEESGWHESYDETKSYPKGSILLRKFRTIEDQGHIAIVWENGKVLHCWPEKGVIIEDPEKGYYERVVPGFLTLD